ncbi:MAG: hypothetical protein Q9192_005008 [Flavoplaca navasiana]
MSRTVADATRFTATSPHAYSKPASILRSAANTFSPSSSPSQTSRRPANAHIPNPAPPPPPSQSQQTETPQQKVARIRALRAAQKLNSMTLWDKIVIRGRNYADTAHRVTVYGLMGATDQKLNKIHPVLAGLITAFSLTDMIIYNRQQSAIYIAAQSAIYDQTLQSAIAAEEAGTPLTEEEQNVMNRERMVLKAEAEREAREKRGWGISAFLFGGTDMGAEDGDDAGSGESGEGGGEKVWGNAEVEGRESLVGLVKEEGVGGPVKDVAKTIGGQGRVMAAIEEKRREGEKPMEEVESFGEPVAAGPLDKKAEEVEAKAKSGWGSWFGGR